MWDTRMHLMKWWQERQHQRYSIFLVNTFSFVAATTLIIFGFLNIIHYQQVRLGFLETAGGVLILINVFALKLHHDVRFACHLLIYTILIELVLMLITGGIYNIGIFWFYIFPEIGRAHV